MTDHLVDANKKVLTEEEIISMAVNALSDFAKYVIAHEREACARDCECIANAPSSIWSETGSWEDAAKACAAEIRERS